MAKLIVMVGVPGSGKSTLSKKLGIKSIGYDDIREEFFGDAGVFYDEDFANRKIKREKIDISGMSDEELLDFKKKLCSSSVFMTLNYRVRECLKNNEDVIIDATSVSKKTRKGILRRFKGMYDSAEAYYFDIPVELAIERNNNRDRKVPIDVIYDMKSRLEVPTTGEGFAVVHIVK